MRSVSAKVLAKLILYLYNEKYDNVKLIKLIETFSVHKKFHQRINFVKMSKVLITNIDLYNNKLKELFFIIVLNDKNLNVKIALCKLIKKILTNDRHILYKDLSIYYLYKIIATKEKSISIKNIFKDIITEDKKDAQELEKYYDKYKYNKKIFIGDNIYFIKEFNIDIDDEKMINIEEVKENKNEILNDEKEEEKNINNEIINKI